MKQILSGLSGGCCAMSISEYSTAELVKELSTRNGVEQTVVAPYQDLSIPVNGPVIVLVVKD